MEHHLIRERDVYIVENHHEVIKAWALARCTLGAALHLITLDTHTDLHHAFLGAAHRSSTDKHAPLSPSDLLHFATSMTNNFNCCDPVDVDRIIEALRHDEHIHAAQILGIVDYAFVALGLHAGSDPHRPRTLVLHEDCLPGCRASPHNEQCIRQHADALLEPVKLSPIITRIESVLQTKLCETNYILDIDLDYFATERGARPQDDSAIAYLIRNAKIITVAQEPGCVADNRLDGETITSESLQQLVLGLIAAV